MPDLRALAEAEADPGSRSVLIGGGLQEVQEPADRRDRSVRDLLVLDGGFL